MSIPPLLLCACSETKFTNNSGPDGAVSITGTSDVVFSGWVVERALRPGLFQNNRATEVNGGGACAPMSCLHDDEILSNAPLWSPLAAINVRGDAIVSIFGE
jgi:hypothetical protein